jgi:hypothetical protein
MYRKVMVRMAASTMLMTIMAILPAVMPPSMHPSPMHTCTI